MSYIDERHITPQDSDFIEKMIQELVKLAQLPYVRSIMSRVLADRAIIDEQHITWIDPDYVECQLQLDEPPSLNLFNAILQEVGKAANLAGEIKVPFDRVMPLERHGGRPTPVMASVLRWDEQARANCSTWSWKKGQHSMYWL